MEIFCGPRVAAVRDPARIDELLAWRVAPTLHSLQPYVICAHGTTWLVACASISRGYYACAARESKDAQGALVVALPILVVPRKREEVAARVPSD